MANVDPAHLAQFEVNAWHAHQHQHKLRLMYYLIRLQRALFRLSFNRAKTSSIWLRQAMRAYTLKESYETSYYIATFYDYISEHGSETQSALITHLKKVQWPLIHENSTKGSIQKFYRELSIDVK